MYLWFMALKRFENSRIDNLSFLIFFLFTILDLTSAQKSSLDFKMKAIILIVNILNQVDYHFFYSSVMAFYFSSRKIVPFKKYNAKN